jgi:hypothetical protein
VQLDEMLDDREAKSKATESSRDRLVRLLESIKHVRQKVRLESDTGIGDGDLGVRTRSSQRHRDPAALRRELDRIGEQVPHYLLKACWIAGDGPHAVFQVTFNSDAFFVSVLLDDVDRLGDNTWEIHLMDIKR